MKFTASYSIIPLLLLSLLLPTAAFAEVSVNVSGNSDNANTNVSVNQQGSSQSTTCVNGKCTSTGSTGKTEVCTNGDCKSYDGDVNYQSDDGTTKINVNNSTGQLSTTPEPTEEENEDDISDTPEPYVSTTSNPEDVHKQVEAVKKEIKHLTKAHHAFISSMLKDELTSLNQLFSKLFTHNR
jgi:hypothetical protein